MPFNHVKLSTGSTKRSGGRQSRMTSRLGHLGNKNPYNRRDPNRWLNYVTIQLYLGLRFVFITQVLPDGVFFQHHPTDDGEVKRIPTILRNAGSQMTKTKQDLTKLDETGERKTDRRKKKTKAEAEASAPVVERRKVKRRRQIDPTTCEREYSDAEIEFMHAMDEYKRSSGRMFPTCSEILEVLLKMGYRKTADAQEIYNPEQPAETQNDEDISSIEEQIA